MAVDTSRRQATIAGIPMKHISLVTLTFQNSALILIMHYSRIMPPVNGQRYFTSTAVFLNEVIKLAVCLTAALYEIASSPHTRGSSTATGLFKELSRAVFTGDSWKLAIPAMLYTLQNTLQYTAVSNLDAATFQVTYQLKILTTALFSVTLLGRSLSIRKWISLVLLMVGVAIVQIPSGMPVVPKAPNTSSNEPSKRSATYAGIDGVAETPELNASVGLVAVMLACMISGLAGVYFEKILKDNRGDGRSASVWVRNVQLSFYSLWPALFIGVLFKDGEHISKSGFFAGYNWVVWTAITFQAMGGVVVALVVNYADNIAKNFATSISIVVSFLASVFFFDFQITGAYVIGTIVVLGATYLYNTQPAEKSTTPPQIDVTDYEKGDQGQGLPLLNDESERRS
ncbi:udp-galactose transporter [Acrodontium crateriforme]|uniref:Udp-galactose transporter n=1 Tax=Acrodontium crateriforme TaxID=150365 RepID=A0AAQ3M5D7_9PEZI|nr:udp-galactose transporter [Acrodontium crateriforme]